MAIEPAVFLARPADFDFIRALGRRVARTSVSSLRSSDPERVTEAVDNVLTYVFGRDHAALVALDGDRQVGFALMVFDIPDEVTLTPQAFLAYMAVVPNYQRQGIGRALLDAAEAEARKRSLPYLSLMVTEENVAAGLLYDAAGFTTERRLMTKAL